MEVQNVKGVKLGGAFSWSQITLSKGVKESFILQGGKRDLELELALLIANGAEIGIDVSYTPIMDTHKNPCTCCGAIVAYSDDIIDGECAICHYR